MDVTINIGMMPEGKKLRSQKSVMIDPETDEEPQVEESSKAVETQTMYIGVDGIISTKPIPRMGSVAHAEKPEVKLGLED